MEELLSLSVERDPQLFFEGLYNFAQRKERSGESELAASLYSNLLFQLAQNPQGTMVPLRNRVQESLEAMQGHGSFGTRAEAFVRNSATLDNVAGGVSHAGALLGLATIACSFLCPLRPLAAGGVHLLSHPRVASALLVSGGYLLVRTAPEAWAAGSRFVTGDYSGGQHAPFEDALLVSGWLLGALGTGVGLSSFALGSRTFALSREAALAQGFGRSEANAVAWMRADAVRRAVQDPEVWTQFARSSPNLLPWQRYLLGEAGHWTSQSLLYGSAAVGLGKFGLGLQQYLSAPASTSGRSGSPGLGNLFLGLALDLSPAVTQHLYRAGRGNRSYQLGPALSQELTERHYQDPALRRIALERLEASIPPLAPAAERAFIRQANRDLLAVERLLRAAEKLAPVNPGPRAPGEPLEIFASVAADLPSAPHPVVFAEGARWLNPAQRAELAAWNLGEIRSAYAEGRVSPVAAVQALLEHPAAGDAALFPRPLGRGPYRARLLRWAEASHRRFERGEARPLEGVLVAVKDLFPGADGLMSMGSKTARVTGVAGSPVLETLLELGAIPVPVGMVAAASGGSGQHAGFGYVPHPKRPGFDPAGSSSATAHVVGREDLPIAIGIGTDTGGSVSAPAGAVGLVGFVPPAGLISTKNMVPFATFLDRVGVLAREPGDALTLARLLSRVAGSDPHQRHQNPGARFEASPTRPSLIYLESVVAQASPAARVNFLKRVEEYRQQGFAVRSLGPEWNFLAEAPLLLYPFDAYAAGVFSHTNPLQRHRFEPPRRTLDENLLVRLPKGGLSLRLGFFDEARRLSRSYQDLVRNKLGSGLVLASPAAEAISTADLAAGRAGALLDGHDRITMAKNRIPEWGQLTLPSVARPEVGLSLAGALPDLMHFTGEVQRVLARIPEPRAPRVLPVIPIFRPIRSSDEAPPRVARAASPAHESL